MEHAGRAQTHGMGGDPGGPGDAGDRGADGDRWAGLGRPVVGLSLELPEEACAGALARLEALVQGDLWESVRDDIADGGGTVAAEEVRRAVLSTRADGVVGVRSWGLPKELGAGRHFGLQRDTKAAAVLVTLLLRDLKEEESILDGRVAKLEVQSLRARARRREVESARGQLQNLRKSIHADLARDSQKAEDLDDVIAKLSRSTVSTSASRLLELDPDSAFASGKGFMDPDSELGRALARLPASLRLPLLEMLGGWEAWASRAGRRAEEAEEALSVCRQRLASAEEATRWKQREAEQLNQRLLQHTRQLQRSEADRLSLTLHRDISARRRRAAGGSGARQGASSSGAGEKSPRSGSADVDEPAADGTAGALRLTLAKRDEDMKRLYRIFKSAELIWMSKVEEAQRDSAEARALAVHESQCSQRLRQELQGARDALRKRASEQDALLQHAREGQAAMFHAQNQRRHARRSLVARESKLKQQQSHLAAVNDELETLRARLAAETQAREYAESLTARLRSENRRLRLDAKQKTILQQSREKVVAERSEAVRREMATCHRAEVAALRAGLERFRTKEIQARLGDAPTQSPAAASGVSASMESLDIDISMVGPPLTPSRES